MFQKYTTNGMFDCSLGGGDRRGGMGVIHCRELDRVITEVQLKPAGSSVRLET